MLTLSDLRARRRAYDVTDLDLIGQLPDGVTIDELRDNDVNTVYLYSLNDANGPRDADMIVKIGSRYHYQWIDDISYANNLADAEMALFTEMGPDYSRLS